MDEQLFEGLIEEYFLESRERLDAIEGALLGLEHASSEQRQEHLVGAKRELHTLKGNSGMMGFADPTTNYPQLPPMRFGELFRRLGVMAPTTPHAFRGALPAAGCHGRLPQQPEGLQRGSERSPPLESVLEDEMGNFPRYIPEGSLVEVTTRTLHGRFLLRPSPLPLPAARSHRT